MYQVEIVPLRIRGPANAMSTAANWLVNYAVVQIAPIAFHNIGYRTYIIFAVFNFVIVPVIYFFYPETGFRSLEEVDVIFYNANQQPKPWLNVRKIAANEPLWYNKNSSDETAFNYEETEWHKKHLRFSDEVKTSEGETTTLRNGNSSNDSDQGKKVSEGSASDDEMIQRHPAPASELDASGPWPNAGSFSPSDAAPSPNVPRLSASRDGRSSGMGY